MKSIFFTLSLFCSTLAFGQDAPVDHINKLSMEIEPVKKDTWSYIKQASRGRSANKIEKKRQELVLSLGSAKSRITRIPAYKGDYSLKKAYANYLNISYLIIKEDYKRIVDLELIAEQTYDAMEAYLLTKEKVNAKMDLAEADLSSAYVAFANKYNITLVDGEADRLTKKLQGAGVVNSYYDKIYLIFFKSSFYESEMIRAQSEGRIGDIEQFRQTLANVSLEGLEELKKTPAFRGDQSLKHSCIKMLNFYKSEAEDHMPSQIEFFSQQDKMSSLTKNIEAKKKKGLTQEDVDNYNLALEEHNSLINSFNKKNNYLNKTRTTKINEFNDSISRFYDKHL